MSLLVLFLAALLFAGMAPGQSAVTVTAPFSTRPVALADLDGDPATGDWSDATTVTVALENGRTDAYGSASLSVKHDGTYLYVRESGKIDVPWTSTTSTHFWIGFIFSPPASTGHHKAGMDGIFFGQSSYTPAPTHPLAPVDTYGGSRPPAKDTAQDVVGTARYSGTAAPYDFTAEWRKPLNSGDAQDLVLTADGATAYPFYATTDSNGGGSEGGGIDHSRATHENAMYIARPPTPESHDVAVTAASASPSSVLQGAPVTVSATVENQGTQAETFDVRAYAGTILVGTQTASALAAGSSRTLTFAWSTAGVAPGSYRIRAEAASVPGETDLADNAYDDGTVVVNPVVHDVAVTAAAATPLSGLVGIDITITASVANQGTQAEAVDVRAYAGTILVGTRNLPSLAAGASQDVSYAWSTTGVAADSYLVRVEAVALAGETDLADNAYDDGTVVLSPVVHDVAVTSASASPLSVLAGSPVAISATVTNQGTQAETFDVRAYAGTILVGTQRASNLAASASQDLRFTWSTSSVPAGSYAIRVEAATLAGETDTADNTFADGTVTVTAVVHDVAVTAAAASPLSGEIGTTVTISATVANQGTQAETFDVRAYAGTILVGTQGVSSLAAGASQDLRFTWSTSSVPAGSYAIRVEAATLAGETDTADNTFADGTVTLSAVVVHDVAVTAASANPLAGLVGTPVTLSASVTNQGTQSETFEVDLLAGGTVVGARTVTLAAGASTTVSVTWDTSLAAPGSYRIRAEAVPVAGETDLADNAYDDGTVVLDAVVHDVAVVSVTASPLRAVAGARVDIAVVIENQGNVPETFDVRTYAGSILVGTQAVTNLGPAARTALAFAWDTSTAEPGSYGIFAEALAVSGETDTADNALTDGTVEILAPVHDVAVTGVTVSALDALVGDTLTIRAAVANEGTQSEAFEVTFLAQGTALGTQSVTLAAGATATASHAWDTKGAAPGLYEISASVAAVAGETDLADNAYVDGVVSLSAPPPALPTAKLGRIWPEWRRAAAGTPQVLYAKVTNTGSVDAFAQVVYEIFDKTTGIRVAELRSDIMQVMAGAVVGDTAFASGPWTGPVGIYNVVATLIYGASATDLSIVDGTKAISRFVVLSGV